MDLLIAFFLGWVVGSIYTNYQHLKGMRQIAKEQGMDLDAMANSIANKELRRIPVFYTEKQNQVIYLYDKYSNTFVSQGNTLEELAKKVVEHNKINVALVVDGDKEFWFFNGEIKNERML